MHHKVNVDLGERSYDIEIAAGLLKNASSFLGPILNRPRVTIITDDNVGPHYLDVLVGALSNEGIESDALSLPAGEATKSWPFLIKSVDWILEKKIERGDIIIALGGGVIGDLVGFVAATVLRGLRFVQIPTSLLAQVDSSVGGKTGINSRHGKNLIGAFHQPSLVLADTVVLETLSKRHLLAGYGEIVKYGLLGNAQFFRWLEENGPALINGDVEMRMEAIRLSCQMKANIIEKDELEHDGRALLNLGHTFCHALEAATGFSERLLHGEGVAIGCVLAFELSARMGLCAPESPSRVREHLKKMGIKSGLSNLNGLLPSAEDLFDLMEQDKKVTNGELRFVLARDIGEAFVAANVDKETVLEILSEQLGKH